MTNFPKKLKPRDAETSLGKHVRCWVNNQVDGGSYDDVSGPLKDLLYGGCQSGMVGHLIYYTETARFYKRYRTEIGEMLGELIEDTGLSVNELFGDNWEKEDPLACDTCNQNLLAWFGFEETARKLAYELEIEV
tara:strand:- start:100 stop:501 length:402 start_codon:yes stop_codon:yes gene_type:complete